jgi:hypothetical protein
LASKTGEATHAGSQNFKRAVDGVTVEISPPQPIAILVAWRVSPFLHNWWRERDFLFKFIVDLFLTSNGFGAGMVATCLRLVLPLPGFLREP